MYISATLQIDATDQLSLQPFSAHGRTLYSVRVNNLACPLILDAAAVVNLRDVLNESLTNPEPPTPL